MSYSKKCVTSLPMTVIVSLSLACFPGSTVAADQASSVETGLADQVSSGETGLAEYLLGPQDLLAIRVMDLEEMGNASLRIDPAGNIDLPLVGPAHVAGLTISQFRALLVEKFRKYVLDPVVTVAVVEFHSQPVTVVGSVNSPGVHQIEGPKRLLEVISIAGGLRGEAGSKVIITRESSSGLLPIPDARNDVGGKFSVGEIELDGLISGKNPSKNIIIRPNDILSVPAAEVIYVLGEVGKPGGFTLHEHASISALEALAMANGPAKTARPKHAHILRVVGDGKPRATIPIDLSRILDGKSPDIPLQPKDILFVPNNVPHAAALRAMETAIQLGTGIIIYRGITGF
jgi:polysaccharide biosynthesis/export protein